MRTAIVNPPLIVSTTTDYSVQNLAAITAVTFANPARSAVQATFGGDQINRAHLHPSTLFTGSAGVNQLLFVGNVVHAESFRFDNWGATDLVHIVGTGFYCDLYGSAARDLIEGGEGTDYITAGGMLFASDTIKGGVGDDWIHADRFALVDGGAGTDLYEADFTSLASPVVIDLRDGGGGRTLVNGVSLTGIEALSGLGSGVDAMVELTSGNDQVIGGSGNDQILGGLGDDTLNGGGGEDMISPGQGNDRVFGSGGDDFLFSDVLTGFSGSGDPFTKRDLLFGGAGDDVVEDTTGRTVMTGGSGRDDFVFLRFQTIGIGPKSDLVTDFTPGEDKIAFVADATSGMGSIVQFIGTGAFSLSAQVQARVQAINGETVMQLGNSVLGTMAEIHFGQLVNITAGDVVTFI